MFNLHLAVNKILLYSCSETGSLCAMKEVDVIPDDPKSSECVRQLEQVILLNNFTMFAGLHSN